MEERDHPVLEYKVFSHDADFSSWQVDNPAVVVFSTQFVLDAHGSMQLGVVYTVKENKPVEKAKEVVKPVDPNPNLN